MMPLAPDTGIPPVSPELVVGGILSIVTALGGWLEGRRRYKKEEKQQAVTEATAASTAAATAESVAISERNEIITIIKNELVEPLRDEVAELRTKVELLEKAKGIMARAVAHLLAIIRKHDLMHEVSDEIRKDIEG